MNRTFAKFGLLVVLIGGLAVFSSCDRSSNARPTDETAKTGTPAGKDDTRKSEYPPVPEAIINADIKAIDGSTFKLADKKGKVILVNLWATWCGPCRSEMPELIALQDQYREQGFEVIGLDTDENETVEQINDFAAEMKLNYTLGWADGKLFSEFIKLTRQPAIPQSMLINRDGRMTGLFTGAGGDLMVKLKKTVEKAVAE